VGNVYVPTRTRSVVTPAFQCIEAYQAKCRNADVAVTVLDSAPYRFATALTLLILIITPLPDVAATDCVNGDSSTVCHGFVVLCIYLLAVLSNSVITVKKLLTGGVI
jgi:hypothetical protein